jgi:hypothetical protein
MSTFRTVDAKTEALANSICGRFRYDLTNAKVTFSVLFAHAPRDKNDEPKGPAIKHGGYAAAGLCRISSHRDRVEGKTDFTIILDGDQWPEWTDRRREAVIMHELLHPELVRDQDGGIVLDDCHRPKLKMRLHDVQIGTFDRVAEVYGEDSIDAEQLIIAARKCEQLEFEFQVAEVA